MGVPWYGYQYYCVKVTGDHCHVYNQTVPSKHNIMYSHTNGDHIYHNSSKKHQQSNSNDVDPHIGREVDLDRIKSEYLPLAIGGRKWDDSSKSPFFTFKNKTTGKYNQIWYDDVESLTYKYKYAVDNGLRGVGMWTADSVNYGAPGKLAKEMWNTLPNYNKM